MKKKLCKTATIRHNNDRHWSIIVCRYWHKKLAKNRQNSISTRSIRIL